MSHWRSVTVWPQHFFVTRRFLGTNRSEVGCTVEQLSVEPTIISVLERRYEWFADKSGPRWNQSTLPDQSGRKPDVIAFSARSAHQLQHVLCEWAPNPVTYSHTPRPVIPVFVLLANFCQV
ncbi:hypothetical protein J6590_025329 [Homalodisca vitripennis]|nr:hypothetical protein J6590_025329 [Homalodisca vitripennis]